MTCMSRSRSLAILIILCGSALAAAEERAWIQIGDSIYGAKPDALGPLNGGNGDRNIVADGDHTARDRESLLESPPKAKTGERPTSAEGGVGVLLENKHLLVEFSSKDGSITRLRNKRRQIELISGAAELGRPWALLLFPFALDLGVQGVPHHSGEARRHSGCQNGLGDSLSDYGQSRSPPGGRLG